MTPVTPADDDPSVPSDHGDDSTGSFEGRPTVRSGLFLSHSSADKDELVRPLAEFLRTQSVNVWYDEYSLRPGDSLSASIDLGLAATELGVVVISPAFIHAARKSGWTAYELRGITANSIGPGGRRLIPVWHDVARSCVLDFAPPLADLVAINTNGKSISELAFKIMEVVAPEKAQSLSIYLALAEASTRPGQSVPVDAIRPAPIKPRLVDGQIVVRSLLVSLVLRDARVAYIGDHGLFLDGLARDAHPEVDLRRWETIAAAYQAVRGQVAVEDRTCLVRLLLGITLGASDPKGVDTSLVPKCRVRSRSYSVTCSNYRIRKFSSALAHRRNAE